MLKLHIRELMEQKDLGIRELARMTDVRPNTVSLWWHGTVKRFDVEHIDKLCDVLDCDVSDLMEHVPDEGAKTDES